jgi:hypothetical protein
MSKDRNNLNFVPVAAAYLWEISLMRTKGVVRTHASRTRSLRNIRYEKINMSEQCNTRFPSIWPNVKRKPVDAVCHSLFDVRPPVLDAVGIGVAYHVMRYDVLAVNETMLDGFMCATAFCSQRSSEKD